MQSNSIKTNAYSNAGFHAQSLTAQIVQKQLIEAKEEYEMKSKNKGLLNNDDFLKGDTFYYEGSF